MALMEDVTLTDSIEIKATPERVFDFLVHLVDDESYRAWHPEDHVALRWLKGNLGRKALLSTLKNTFTGNCISSNFLLKR